jgi:hypothetical protein
MSQLQQFDFKNAIQREIAEFEAAANSKNAAKMAALAGFSGCRSRESQDPNSVGGVVRRFRL